MFSILKIASLKFLSFLPRQYLKIPICLSILTLAANLLTSSANSSETVLSKVQLNEFLIKQLKYNFRSTWVTFDCEGLKAPVTGTHTFDETSVYFRFVVAETDWQGKDCWVDHMGSLENLPTNWYQRLASDQSFLIRGSLKGRVKNGILYADFMEATKFTFPAMLELEVDSAVIDFQGRDKITLEKIDLFCPQSSPQVASNVAYGSLPVVLEKAQRRVKLVYLVPFVKFTERNLQCRQIWKDSDGYSYSSDSWMIFDQSLDGNYFSATKMEIAGNSIKIN